MKHGKPIIGITGGIGSGKSFIAQLFAEEGCTVICADDLVRRAYEDPAVKSTLRSWWRDSVFDGSGNPDRKALAQKIFNDEVSRRRLEQLLHPLISQMRDEAMASADSATKAFIWDTPLLMETGLNEQCDAVVFVDAPEELRRHRVQQNREWDASELARRENLQMPLDKKRSTADYIVQNASDAASSRHQVRQVLSRILAIA